jgi:hypothetical protein
MEGSIVTAFLFQWPPFPSRRKRHGEPEDGGQQGVRLCYCNSQVYFSGLHFQIGYGGDPGDRGQQGERFYHCNSLFFISVASISLMEKETVQSPRMEDSQEDDPIIGAVKFISVASIAIEDTAKSQGMESSIGTAFCISVASINIPKRTTLSL